VTIELLMFQLLMFRQNVQCGVSPVLERFHFGKK